MPQKNYCKWKEREVKELFCFVEQCKEKHMPLTTAFLEYAKKTNRMPNSVRNYYYLELSELQKNEARRKALNINLNKHEKQEFKAFTRKEEFELAYFILQNERQGKSIRSSCLELSGNDVNGMIRFQNKFRSLLKTNKELIKSVNMRLDATMGVKKEEKQDNIIAFSKTKKEYNSKLTEEEIKGLFMGLIKLVKKMRTLRQTTILKRNIILQ